MIAHFITLTQLDFVIEVDGITIKPN